MKKHSSKQVVQITYTREIKFFAAAFLKVYESFLFEERERERERERKRERKREGERGRERDWERETERERERERVKTFTL